MFRISHLIAADLSLDSVEWNIRRIRIVSFRNSEPREPQVRARNVSKHERLKIARAGGPTIRLERVSEKERNREREKERFSLYRAVRWREKRLMFTLMLRSMRICVRGREGLYAPLSIINSSIFIREQAFS